MTERKALMAEDVLTIHAGEQLTIRTPAAETNGELLVVEATWTLGAGGAPPLHLHPAQDEHFEVLAGELRADVAGTRQTLHAGDVLDIPRGTPHRMWATGAETARATWEVRPALRTEQWFRTLDALHRESAPGEPGILALAAALRDFRQEMRVILPAGLDRVLFPALAGLGRLRRRPYGFHAGQK